MKSQRFLKGFLILNASQAIVLFCNFFTWAYLSRTLTLKDFGILNGAIALVSSLMAFVDLGLPIYGTREVAQNPKSIGEYSATITSLRMMVSLICVVILVFLVPKFYSDSTESLTVILACTWLLAYSFNLEWLFQGLSSMVWIAISRITFQVVLLLSIILLVNTTTSTALIATLRTGSQFIASGILVFRLIAVIRQNKYRFVMGSLGRYLLASLPLGLAGYFAQVYSQRLDHVILRAWQSPEAVGIYSSAYTIHLALLGIVHTVITISMPILSRSYALGTTEFLSSRKQFLSRVLLVALPLSAITFIFAPYVLSLAFGSRFETASLALRILAFDPLIIGISSTYAYGLIASNTNKQTVLTYAAGAIGNLSLNFLLIPQFSINGAAFATIASEIIVLFVGRYFFNQKFSGKSK